jgi:hypothetical protein
MTEPDAPRPLAAGDEVFRVVEYDPPDPPGASHTWMMSGRRIVKIRRDGMIVLDRPFPGMPTRNLSIALCGTHYHRSVDAAIIAFWSEMVRKLSSASRMLADAERGIAWSRDQDLDAGRIA